MPSVTLRKSLMALAIASTLTTSLATAGTWDLSGGFGFGVGDGSHQVIGTVINGLSAPYLFDPSGVVPVLDWSADATYTRNDVHAWSVLNIDGGASVETMNNTGRLLSTGATTYAIWVNNGVISTLNNSGTIQSAATAIRLTSLTGSSTINHNAGTISGATAIDASSAGQNVTLNWNGGTIGGSLTGIKTFNLNLDHANLGGNLTMAAGSTIRMRLTADSSTPVLKLNNGGGSFNLGNGSQILLRPSANNFAVNNQTYTLIDGESGSALGLSVLSDSPYLTVHGFNLATDLFATVSINNTPQINGSPNAQRAGSAITSLLSGMANSSPNNPVLDALAGSQAVQTTEQLVPQVNGAALQSAYGLNNMANFNANQRTQGLRGASAGDAFVERGLWIKALGSDVTQDARDGIEGYDADLSGLAIGADGKLSDQLTLGLSYSYLNSDISADGGNKAEIDGHAITLYSGYEQDAWFVDSNLTLGLNHNDSTRYIAGTEAEGDYDSQLLGLDVLGGYGFELDNGLLLEPRAAARYARVDIDSFREKGSIAALDVDDQRYEVAELGAGLRVAGNLPLGQGNLQPQATLMVYHDFAADQVATNASFTFGGSPFLATGASPARTRYEAGIGVDYVLANTTIGISYDYSGKEDFQADTLQAKVRYDF